MVIREEEHVITHREMTREAISLAMESRWQEAITVNRNILALSDEDLDASNRLGKSLLELGDVDGARIAFDRSLAIDPENVIARKNADRLSGSSSAQAANAAGTRFAQKMFIGDSGKSAQVTLLACATDSARPFISPGAPVELRTEQGTLAVFNQDGHYIGLVPPKLGRRLVGLIEEGNRYEGAISGSSGDAIKVVLQESYQHPSLRSKVSFLSAFLGAENPSVGEAQTA
jgi:tetratricopeptide (TPR) repeat protein